MSKQESSDSIFYFIGNITSHVLHALPLWQKLGGTFVVTSEAAKKTLSQYDIPVICLDNVPHVWKWRGKKPQKVYEYIRLGPRFKNTSAYLNKNARVVIFYELFEFSRTVELTQPKKVFLTHGNMLKNYLKMYPRRLDILQSYNYMAALGPFMKQEFIDSGVSAKKLVDIGVARTDEVVAIRDKIRISNTLHIAKIPTNKPIISYLPTFWGDSSVEVLGVKMLEKIASDYTVLFRPHPQTPQKIIEKYSNVISKRDNIIYLPEQGPSSPSLIDIYAASSLIIGDLSSVMLEAVLLDKPLVFAAPDTANDAKTHSQIDDIISYSQSISMNNIDTVNEIVSTALKDGIDTALWQTAKDRCFYHHDGTSVSSIKTFVKSLS